MTYASPGLGVPDKVMSSAPLPSTAPMPSTHPGQQSRPGRGSPSVHEGGFLGPLGPPFLLGMLLSAFFFPLLIENMYHF